MPGTGRPARGRMDVVSGVIGEAVRFAARCRDDPDVSLPGIGHLKKRDPGAFRRIVRGFYRSLEGCETLHLSDWDPVLEWTHPQVGGLSPRSLTNTTAEPSGATVGLLSWLALSSVILVSVTLLMMTTVVALPDE